MQPWCSIWYCLLVSLFLTYFCNTTSFSSVVIHLFLNCVITFCSFIFLCHLSFYMVILCFCPNLLNILLRSPPNISLATLFWAFWWFLWGTRTPQSIFSPPSLPTVHYILPCNLCFCKLITHSQFFKFMFMLVFFCRSFIVISHMGTSNLAKRLQYPYLQK